MVSSKLLSTVALVAATICAITIPVVVSKGKSRGGNPSADANLILDPYGPSKSSPTSIPSATTTVEPEETAERVSVSGDTFVSTDVPSNKPVHEPGTPVLPPVSTVTASPTSIRTFTPSPVPPTNAPPVTSSNTNYPTIDTLWKACKVGNNAVKASVPQESMDLFFACHLAEFGGNSNLCEWPLAGPSTVTKTWVWQVCPTQCYNQSGCFSRPSSGSTTLPTPPEAAPVTTPAPSSIIEPTSTEPLRACNNEATAQATLFRGSDNEFLIECQFIGVAIDDKVCDLYDSPSTPVWSICKRECWKHSGCADEVFSERPSTTRESDGEVEQTDGEVVELATTANVAPAKPDHCQLCRGDMHAFKIQDPNQEEVMVELVCNTIGDFVEPMVCEWGNVDTPGAPVWNTCCDHCTHLQEANVCSASESPSEQPSSAPTLPPTVAPSSAPSNSPSHSPSKSPTAMPSDAPSLVPTGFPSTSPTNSPSASPTETPTDFPSGNPSSLPTPWCTSDDLVTFDVTGESVPQSVVIPCSSIGFYIDSSVCKWLDKTENEEPVWMACRVQCSDQSGC